MADELDSGFAVRVLDAAGRTCAAYFQEREGDELDPYDPTIRRPPADAPSPVGV